MINANELRIGNLVSNRQSCFLVIPQTLSAMFHEHCHPVEPIPLTDEWLLKFGFEKGYIALSSVEYLFVSIKNMEYSIIPIDSVTSGMMYIKSIKYVHQLQNLYFALTGKELAYS